MTLVRGNIRGYEDDRMVLLFSMMDDAREVPCAVSAAAMDDLERVPRTPANQREAVSAAEELDYEVEDVSGRSPRETRTS